MGKNKKPIKQRKVFVWGGLFILMALVFLPTIFALGADYTVLAPIPGTYNANNKTNLATYFSGAYKTLIAIAGVLAVFMIVWGGFKYATTDAIYNKQDGKEKIKGAVFGLILIMSSWLILNTINPSLANIGLSNLKPLTAKNWDDFFEELSTNKKAVDQYWQNIDKIIKNNKEAAALARNIENEANKNLQILERELDYLNRRGGEIDGDIEAINSRVGIDYDQETANDIIALLREEEKSWTLAATQENKDKLNQKINEAKQSLDKGGLIRDVATATDAAENIKLKVQTERRFQNLNDIRQNAQSIVDITREKITATNAREGLSFEDKKKAIDTMIEQNSLKAKEVCDILTSLPTGKYNQTGFSGQTPIYYTQTDADTLYQEIISDLIGPTP